jgi:hypothetical protein
MEDPSAKDVSQEKKDEVVNKVMEMMDKNNNRIVEKEEWEAFNSEGKELPDFGLGPGHHWDM